MAALHLRGPARRVRPDPARPRGPPAGRDAAPARHGGAGGLRRRRRDRRASPRRAGSREVRARFLVDASGRDALPRLAPRAGAARSRASARWRSSPTSAARRRWPGREEGNIRIFIFEAGWFWYIPFADGDEQRGLRAPRAHGARRARATLEAALRRR